MPTILFENKDNSGGASDQSASVSFPSNGELMLQFIGDFTTEIADIEVSGFNDGTNDIFSFVESVHESTVRKYYGVENAKLRVSLSNLQSDSDITIVEGAGNVAT